MLVFSIPTRPLHPPKDDLLEAIRASTFAPEEGDCIAITSKVVSIWQGRCVPIDTSVSHQRDLLAQQESELYMDREHVPHHFSLHTITQNNLIGGAGIDASNADGHYVLWPEKLQETARGLLEWCKETYGCKELYLVITDSKAMPLRRGAIGFALAWAGFDPLFDHRGQEDIFGRVVRSEHTNVADALASSAVLVMGETNECTPLAIVRDAPYLKENKGDEPEREYPFSVPIHNDKFAPFLQGVPWKKGGKGV